MHIQREIDKKGASLCNQSVSNIPPIMFAVIGTEDEVFWCSVPELIENVSATKSH